MNIGEYSVRNKVVSWLLVVILVGGGRPLFSTSAEKPAPCRELIAYYNAYLKTYPSKVLGYGRLLFLRINEGSFIFRGRFLLP